MKLIKIIFILLAVFLVGCCSYSSYFNHNKKEVLQLGGYDKYRNGVVVVDSIKSQEFVILISKENHLFYTGHRTKRSMG